MLRSNKHVQQAIHKLYIQLFNETFTDLLRYILYRYVIF